MKIITVLAISATMSTAAPVIAQTVSPVRYVAEAGASDLYERRSSEIVLQTTRDPRVRQFATMMISHHTRSTQQVVTAARRAGVRPVPPRLMPMQARMIAQLRAEPSRTRDAAYIAQQRAAHGQALELHRAYSMSGTARPLRSAAAGIVPVVEQHLAMLQSM